jgi:hypothetical protein
LPAPETLGGAATSGFVSVFMSGTSGTAAAAAAAAAASPAATSPFSSFSFFALDVARVLLDDLLQPERLLVLREERLARGGGLGRQRRGDGFEISPVLEEFFQKPSALLRRPLLRRFILLRVLRV